MGHLWYFQGCPDDFLCIYCKPWNISPPPPVSPHELHFKPHYIYYLFQITNVGILTSLSACLSSQVLVHMKIQQATLLIQTYIRLEARCTDARLGEPRESQGQLPYLSPHTQSWPNTAAFPSQSSPHSPRLGPPYILRKHGSHPVGLGDPRQHQTQRTPRPGPERTLWQWASRLSCEGVRRRAHHTVTFLGRGQGPPLVPALSTTFTVGHPAVRTPRYPISQKD